MLSEIRFQGVQSLYGSQAMAININKMQKVILSLLLVTLVASFQDTKTVLTELDSDQFGNTLISMVQVYMQSKGSVEEVNLLLNTIASGILENQNKHDALRRTEQAACNKITNDLQQTIGYHSVQITANQALLEDNTAALADAEVDIRQTIKDIEQNEATTTSEQNTRNQQNAVFTRKFTQTNEAIVAVDEASKLIQHLQLGTSFSQLKGRFDAVQKKLAENESHGALFQPIITALTELATQVDQKAIAQIAQLLAQLRQQLVEAANNLKDTEDKQVARFNEFYAHLTNEHSRLADRKSQLSSAISQYHENIQEAQRLLEIHTVEKEAAEFALDAQEKWCAHEEQDYETQTAERTRQADIVARIQEHLIDKLTATSQYLNGRF